MTAVLAEILRATFIIALLMATVLVAMVIAAYLSRGPGPRAEVTRDGRHGDRGS